MKKVITILQASKGHEEYSKEIHSKIKQLENISLFKMLSEFYSVHVVAKSTAEPGNSNDLQLANTSTPFYYRAFFVRSTRTPKERLERLSMVACNGKGSPFAVFQLSQFSSPLHVTAQTLESLAVALQKLQLELLAMIYLFKAVSRRDLRNTTKPIHTFPCYTLRIKAESLEQAKSIVCPLFAVMGVAYA